jgi:hypothetical protein
MPSEKLATQTDRVRIALDAGSRQRSTYRSAVIAAHERAKGILAAGGGADRAALELGQFAGARINAARFAAIDSADGGLDSTSRSRIEDAASVLRALAQADESSFVVDVPRGGRLRFAVASALAELGCAFGAVATIELVKAGRFDSVLHSDLINGLWFDLWGKAERLAAPPLVVRMNGQDLRAGVLTDFLDGAVKIALVVEGTCAPAPLVRLVTPGTFVLQTTDTTGVDLFAKFGGPAVMALVPPSAACFVHDPNGGRAAWQRLRIWNRPTSAPRKALGGLSARQQNEELLQLDALAKRPSLESAPMESLVPVGSGDPADRLADWLLDASGFGAQ